MGEMILQLPCSLVQGAPTEDTPGFVGAFVMDVSETGRGNVYKCIDKGDSGCVWVLMVGGVGSGGSGGQNGITPHIGANGNWFIGDTDTGVKAAGYTPQKGVDYYTEEDKDEMVQSVLAALPTWEGGSY